MNRFFYNKTSQQKVKMNRFTVLESRNRLSIRLDNVIVLVRLGEFHHILASHSDRAGRGLTLVPGQSDRRGASASMQCNVRCVSEITITVR